MMKYHVSVPVGARSIIMNLLTPKSYKTRLLSQLNNSFYITCIQIAVCTYLL